MSTKTNCNQEMSNFIDNMIPSLKQHEMVASFNYHLTMYNMRLQREWRPLQAELKSHEQLPKKLETVKRLGNYLEKLEAAQRLGDLANQLKGRAYPSDPKQLKEQLTKDLHDRASNPHWDNVKKYQNIQEKYLSAKNEMKNVTKEIDEAKKKLDNLKRPNGFFSSIFTKHQKLNNDEYLKWEQALTKLQQKLTDVKNKVEDSRKEAYNTYTQGSTFKRIFSRDHHITKKLDEMIQQEIRQSGKYERKWAQQPDQNGISTPEKSQAAPVAPQVQPVPVLQVAQESYLPSPVPQLVAQESYLPSPVPYTAQVSPVPQHVAHVAHVAHVSPAPVPQVAQVLSTPAPLKEMDLKEINSKTQPSTVNLQVNSSSEASRQVRQTRNLATFNALPRQTTMKDIYRMANESLAQEKRNLQKFREDIRPQPQGAVGNRADGVEKPQNSLADSMSHDRSGDLRLDR
jgi:hypothetical protein